MINGHKQNDKLTIKESIILFTSETTSGLKTIMEQSGNTSGGDR